MVLLPCSECCKSCGSILRGGSIPQSIEVDLSGSSAKSCTGELRQNNAVVATASVSFPAINGTYSLSPTAGTFGGLAKEYIYDDSNINLRLFSYYDGSISQLTLSFKVPHTADDKNDAQQEKTVIGTYSVNGNVGRYCNVSTFQTYYEARPPAIAFVPISYAMNVPPSVGRIAFTSGCQLPVLVTCHAYIAYNSSFAPSVTGSFDNSFRSGSNTNLVAYIPVVIAAVRSIYSEETVDTFGPVDSTTCTDFP
jgi:hypothetical protein